MARMNIIIGSGPAGTACAAALLARGEPVRMLDGGLTLEPERAKLVEKFRRSQPADWTATDLAAYQSGMNPDVGGVPTKLVYGSDFPYREADERQRPQLRDAVPAEQVRQLQLLDAVLGRHEPRVRQPAPGDLR